MKILFYSYKNFEKDYLTAANKESCIIGITKDALSLTTASKAQDYKIVSVFAGDDVSAPVVEALYKNGVKYIAIRAAGYDNVDIKKCAELKIQVANVPEYSPYAIAEHAVALVLALNRKLIIANQQVHQQNFSIDNLIGIDLHDKTVGIIGAGKIGSVFAKIMHGFGCRLLGYDIKENKILNKNYGLQYADLNALCQKSDIISIHTPLALQTKYIINESVIKSMKKGVILINTSRGACVNTADVIAALEAKHIGFYGADVYEKEKNIFFYDYSNKDLSDEMLVKLLHMPNVIITPHQAFATKEALTNIAETTFYNIDCWNRGKSSINELTNK